jgi:hypothetical protein
MSVGVIISTCIQICISKYKVAILSEAVILIFQVYGYSTTVSGSESSAVLYGLISHYTFSVM